MTVLTLLLARETSYRTQLLHEGPQLHDPVSSHKQLLPQRVHDLFSQHSLDLVVPVDVFVCRWPEQKAVEHAVTNQFAIIIPVIKLYYLFLI